MRIHRTVLTEATVSNYASEEIPDWRALGLELDKPYALLRVPNELCKAVKTVDALPLTHLWSPPRVIGPSWV